jgi:hypothetical protein
LVTWEEWCSYLETLRTVGPKNNGGIDVGVMQRNLQVARIVGMKNKEEKENPVSASADPVPDFTDTQISVPPPTSTNDPTASEPEPERSSGRAGRVLREGPPSAPSSPARNNFFNTTSNANGTVDPVSGLPYTESDYKRMDSEATRAHTANLQREMFLKESGGDLENLQQVNSQLRKQLSQAATKTRLRKSKTAVESNRAKRLLNADIELAVATKAMTGRTSKRARSNPTAANSGAVYGIADDDDVDINPSDDARVIHLQEVNKLLKRSLAAYQKEAEESRNQVALAQSQSEEISKRAKSYFDEETGKLLMSPKNQHATPGFSEDRFRLLQKEREELEMEKNSAAIQAESLKAENNELRSAKLTLARRASRAVDSERTATTNLDIERRRTQQLSAELERSRQVIAAHEREALHRNAEQKLVILAAARDRARREAEVRKKLRAADQTLNSPNPPHPRFAPRRPSPSRTRRPPSFCSPAPRCGRRRRSTRSARRMSSRCSPYFAPPTRSASTRRNCRPRRRLPPSCRGASAAPTRASSTASSCLASCPSRPSGGVASRA